MGFAIAESLARKGAYVELVTGPVHLSISHPNINRTDVNTAEEMYQVCVRLFPSCKGAILSAAVADYRPQNSSLQKIKKESTDTMHLELVKNKDILATLGTIKARNQLLIGFSLETDNELNNARDKMKRKNCDAIILNSLKDSGAGFSLDTNKITILTQEEETLNFPVKTKREVAMDIVDFIIRRYF
jgi:phosphopantothenoylcysteine decarboxylase / phosphopantothenate---cysteine ligase